jgi:hypothetical protein
MNARERRMIFPFNKAKKILLVSYTPVWISISDSELMGVGGLPYAKGKIDFTRFHEIITLNNSQIDTLTNVFYNYRFLPYSYEEHLAENCLSENAILFINKRNKCFAHLELWFKGPDFERSTEEMDLGEFCNQKLDLIKEFFRNNGIKEGLDSTDNR